MAVMAHIYPLHVLIASLAGLINRLCLPKTSHVLRNAVSRRRNDRTRRCLLSQAGCPA